MFADSIITGLLVGSTYALVAMGLTLQYGIARIMNLAHGEMIIAAAFAALWLYLANILSPLVAAFVLAPVAYISSWFIYRVFLVPLVRRSKTRGALEVDSILCTFGLLFVVQGVMLVLFGGDYYSYSYLSIPVELGEVRVGLNRLVAFAGAMTFGVSLYVLLYRTRVGTAMRALAVDPTSAGLVAINVPKMSAFAFALGGAIAASGGVFLSMFLTFNASMGVIFTTKALIVVIMGGVGDIRGALIAGLLLGVAETLVATFVDPNLTLTTVYGLFLITLVYRPAGLFGARAR